MKEAKSEFIAIAQILSWGGNVDDVPRDDRAEFGRWALAQLGLCPQDALDKELCVILRRKEKIIAIKLHREKTGFGLKESKLYVEELAKKHGIDTRPDNCNEI